MIKDWGPEVEIRWQVEALSPVKRKELTNRLYLHMLEPYAHPPAPVGSPSEISLWDLP